jgi:ribose 5-phosphate isomerase B
MVPTSRQQSPASRLIVALGSDHAGFPLKARLAKAVTDLGHELLDCGAKAPVPGDDYPDYALKVGRAIVERRAQRGILLCGSGVGIGVAANKLAGVRAALCHDTFSARQGVEDDDMNVLCLGARVIGPELAVELVRTFLAARFSDAERHRRRLDKVVAMERGTG